jgi:hypothetical protein
MTEALVEDLIAAESWKQTSMDDLAFESKKLAIKADELLAEKK